MDSRAEALDIFPKFDTGIVICVDLDGTILKTDTLQESTVSAVFSDWRALYSVPRWLWRGRAFLKQKLASRWVFDPAILPYDETVLAALRREKDRGRRLILVTGSDLSIASRIADHLDLFDEVIASDGTNNLRGENKAKLLQERFEGTGFAYIGNDSTDHAVWRIAEIPIAANVSSALARSVTHRYPNGTVLSERNGALFPLIRALRPYQWAKNLLVLIPLYTSGAIGDLGAWLHSFEAVAAFCALASAIYLLNDLGDLAADRAHPRKRSRPFANGTLTISTGIFVVPLLVLAGTALGAMSGAIVSLGIYVALSVAYTVWLKEQPLVDVFILAALYTLRLLGGGEASGHEISLWLLGFSSFVFLSLALVKRVSELLRIQGADLTKIDRRGYLVDDLFILQAFGSACTFASAVVLSLYVQSNSAESIYHRPAMLWGLVPLFLFWQCRLWLSTARGYMHDDPVVYAARDWVSWIVIALAAGIAFAARTQII